MKWIQNWFDSKDLSYGDAILKIGNITICL